MKLPPSDTFRTNKKGDQIDLLFKYIDIWQIRYPQQIFLNPHSIKREVLTLSLHQ